MVRKLVLWVLTLSVAACIFVFSGQSAEQSSAISGAVSQGLLGSLFSFLSLNEAQQELFHILLRSGAHIFMFALLGFFASLLARSYQLKRWKVITFTSCLAYAVVDECHQLLFAAGRAFEWSDILKDGCGVLIGILLVWFFSHLAMRIRAAKETQKEGN